MPYYDPYALTFTQDLTKEQRQQLKCSGIYLITQYIETTNKYRYYVGSSINLFNRYRNHKYALLNKKHPNAYLQNACNKYGIDTFTYKVINIICSETSEELIQQLELTEHRFIIEFISKGCILFNINIDTDRTNICTKGTKHSPVTINRNRRAKQQWAQTEEGRAKILKASQCALEVTRKPTPKLIHVITKHIIDSFPSRLDLCKHMNWEKKHIGGLFTGKLNHYKGYIIMDNYPDGNYPTELPKQPKKK